ncbi:MULTISPECIES: hypothetical protein [Microbacterium]|uniref:endonuclease toxin domain-containing protein n=1 Tax=Microbacterium TaxID=33882 RepID=UPI000CCE6437|nr:MULTISPECIES: hypothetical protein [Microbacterium]PNW08372.1 hypothetical protein C1632_11010 [Microbacterium testaceum]WAC68602.1 hypothetical protein OVA17_13520 [Microbacterium sp. SL75]
MLITVDPDAWYAASTKFGANVARTLSDAESALGATLADSGRIAGNDPSGAAWAQAYDQTAPAVAQAINDAVAAALTVSGLLRQTGLNHASADADSNALGAMLQAPIAVDAPAFGVCVSVPSVAGGSLGPPNGWLDIQKYVAVIWPDGDPTKLRALALAWRDCATTLESAWPSISSALTALADEESPEVDSARGVCITVGDSLTDIAAQARAIADSAETLAQHIDDAQNELRKQVALFLAETAAIEAIALAAGAATEGAGLLVGHGVAVFNASKYTVRFVEIVVRLAEGARAAAAGLAWRSLDATSDGLRAIAARTPSVAATASVTGAAEKLTALADKLAKSPWPFGPSPRGFAIEARLGGNLPASFPTIDRFNDATGVATSIKSIDLASKTYLVPSRLRGTLRGYIDRLAEFKGATWGGREIDDIAIQGRELQLAVPRTATAEQQAVLNSMKDYALEKGVRLTVEVIR